ncbi:MAG: hypothetical protein EWV40_19185 [Microcystis flos-aquae Mf_WU_F_19750830_S460]|uniref:Type IV pilin PilA n=1 Tax=Microcystis flos-aquae Mf_WU_F_19750830_S460 TaxID=2486237 RepID=A0A552LAB5_9CHRO|nr:MAG: hypothetical protein EWV40_19185 [Microcystis flos-aquae Mf_WU_F_19750830_S460]
MRQKVFRGGRVWGVGCGVWGFTHFQGVNYLIFREKVPKKFLSNKVFRFIQQTLIRVCGKKSVGGVSSRSSGSLPHS